MTKDFTEIDGVGDAIAEQLREAGFETVADVQNATVDDLADVHMLGEASATAILEGEGSGKGRPTVYDRDKHDTIVQTIRNIEPLTSAAERASISVDTIRNWYDEGERQSELPPSERSWEYDFFDDCADARAEAKAELLQKMEREDIDWRMVAWKLEHLYESEFYLPIKQEIAQEVNLDADVDSTHDVTADFVTFGGDDGDE